MDTVLALVPVTASIGGIVKTASFCQAVPWWKWCRVKPRGRNCWLPWNC